MHIFLTGAKGVGKSTALQAFLASQPACPMGGFRTLRRVEGDLVTVAMLPADPAAPPPADPVVMTRDAGGFHPRPSQFDALGPALLAQPGDILLMDELGHGEREATAFQEAVLSCLDGPLPVVGVVQAGASDFLEKVREHPKVTLLEVTAQNRDGIPARMAALWSPRRVSCVVMASGHSKRFGQDKLLYPLDGVPMLARVLGALPRDLLEDIFVVARTQAVLDLAESLGCAPVPNPDRTDDTAVTIRLGIQALPPGTEGCLFAVGDQPWVSPNSLRRLVAGFVRDPHQVAALGWQGVRGNPVLFPRAYFPALAKLPPGQSGRFLLGSVPVAQIQVADPLELQDVDSLQVLKNR